jgi:predicted chitinase
MINRDSFFSKYKNHFGSLKQSQVDELNFLLDKLDESSVFSLASEYAYILSTIKHECAEKYKPVTEYGSQTYLKGKSYYPFIGRGYVQLTWKANYQKFSDLLEIDLVSEPELALDPENSWKILELGMSEGLYTGKKLADYVNEEKTDYKNARRVINGTDKAELLAGYAEKFYDCIDFE